MECITLIAATPEELAAETARLLTTFDLYQVNNSVTNVGGKVQFIAFVYGKYKVKPE